MEWGRKNGIILAVGIVGIGLLVYGIWEQIKPGEVKVEIIKAGQEVEGGSGVIVVDVAGAVEKVGVYKLARGSRIGDAIVVAGGLSEKADREWIAKNLNLAKEMEDQEKVFIPERSQTIVTAKQESQVNVSRKVNINTADITELDKLDGIGEVRARIIIENRPYSNLEELMSKAKIPSSVYEKIKSDISVY